MNLSSAWSRKSIHHGRLNSLAVRTIVVGQGSSRRHEHWMLCHILEGKGKRRIKTGDVIGQQTNWLRSRVTRHSSFQRFTPIKHCLEVVLSQMLRLVNLSYTVGLRSRVTGGVATTRYLKSYLTEKEVAIIIKPTTVRKRFITGFLVI